jgi:hypothetical protein
MRHVSPAEFKVLMAISRFTFKTKKGDEPMTRVSTLPVPDVTGPDIELLVAKDLKAAAQKLSSAEARFAVDLYYQVQEFRKATANQIRSLGQDEPGELIGAIFGSMEKIEGRIKKGLDYYTDTQPLGVWCKDVVGIGPVIAAGLLAHIDLTKCKTVGGIWRFAGLDPTSKWSKGEKRPWNASLKRLCWIIGESFVKVSGNPKSVYGKLYVERKAYEQQRNDKGELADQAKTKLETVKIGKDTEAYKHYSVGRLPPAHIHERSKRWVVKLFLAHYHEAGCRLVLGKEPPEPYSLVMLGHVHKIEPEIAT